VATFRSAATATTGSGIGTNTIAVSVPAGVQSGDLLLCFIGAREGGEWLELNGGSIPSGWARKRSDTSANSNAGQRVYCYWKIAGGSEPASYTWTKAGTGRTFNAVMLAYSGVKTSNPFIADTGGSNATGSSSPQTASLDAGSGTHSTLVWAAVGRDAPAGSMTIPGSMNQRGNLATSLASNIVGMMVADQSISSGATGTRTGSYSSSYIWATEAVILNDVLDNTAPTANAGADRQNHPNETATLDGSASNDPDGTLTYSWSQIEGDTAAPASATSATTTVTPTTPGKRVYRLTVTDDANATATDDMTVVTLPAGLWLATASGNSASCTVTLPAGAVAGDTAFVTIAARANQLVTSTQTGWEVVRMSVSIANTSGVRLITLMKTLGSGDLGQTVSIVFPFAIPWAMHAITVPGLHANKPLTQIKRNYALGTPAIVSATPAVTGSTTYSYRVTPIDGGGEALPSAAYTITNGPASLSGVNNVAITWNPVYRATSYNIYRGTGSNNETYIGTTGTTNVGNSVYDYRHGFTDTGQTTSGATPPSTYPSGAVLDTSPFESSNPLTAPFNSAIALLQIGANGSSSPDWSLNTPSGTSFIAQTAYPHSNQIVLASYWQSDISSGAVTSKNLAGSQAMSNYATHNLLLRPSGANASPVANAGIDQVVLSGDTVTLNGTSSYDPDGDSLTYSWTQQSGTTVSINNISSINPTFFAPATAGDLTFQLTVTDTSNSHSTDTVTVTVVRKHRISTYGSGRWQPKPTRGRIGGGFS